MAQDGPESRVWLVDATSITVEGDIDQVRRTWWSPFGAEGGLPRRAPRAGFEPATRALEGRRTARS
jgi:hypothetical protein